MTRIFDLLHIPCGVIASVDRGLYSHVGILAEPVPGQPRTVVSLNPGAPSTQLREETLPEFGRARVVNLLPPLSALSASFVLGRARSGQHPQYSWTEFNCEHFLCFAFGVPLESPQLRRIATISALAFLALKAA